MSLRVTEANYPEQVLIYATEHYPVVVLRAPDMCPYDLARHGESYAGVQAMVWATHAWISPDTGRTIMEEFADERVKNEKLAARLSRVREIVFDEFSLIDGGDADIVRVRAESGGAEYEFRTKSVYKVLFMRVGRIAAAIHPWYKDGTYKPAGLIQPLGKG